MVPAAIQGENSGLAFDRILLARALGTTPSSSAFTLKLNSSARYGLTRGGYNDATISLTELGKSLVAPENDQEASQSSIEASLHPEPFRRFYELLKGKRVPDDAYARNMLHRELGVQPDLTEECLLIIKANGLHTGIITEIGGSLYVSLPDLPPRQPGPADHRASPPDAATRAPNKTAPPSSAGHERHSGGKIFIGHVDATEMVDFLKGVLETFGIPYGVVDGDHDGGAPISPEVAREMRLCSAAVLVIARSEASGGGRDQRDDRMRYQLGAASVLYGDRVVLLEETGLESHDSDLGLKVVEFQRDRLDELGLPLLAELHRMQIIEVQAWPTAQLSEA